MGRPEFDAMAKWYDFDYDRRMRKDLPFYRKCAEDGGNPVLELGAGTARVTAHLVKHGFDVTGVELSRQMLERGDARLGRIRGASGRGRLVLGDMADLDVKGRFGTVLVPFRAFHHLYDTSRQLAALAGIRRRLKPDGLAVFDLVNPDLAELLAADGKVRVTYERKHPKRGTRVVQRFRIRSDLPRQIAYIDYIWDEYRGQRKVGSDTAPMRWRWFHRFEFEHLLARAGLRSVRVCGDYDERPYEADSEEMIFFAVKD
jgi:SAM-dependent methyltransferase